MARMRPYLEAVAMYCAAFVAVLLYARHREGQWDYVAAGLFALVAAVYFFFDQNRSRKVTVRNQQDWDAALEAARAQVIQQANGTVDFNEACGSVAEAMSYLSPGDLSIFAAILERFKAGEENAGFMTVPDSPMHIILQRLEGVDCAQPKDFFPAHDAAMALPCVTYELTELGRLNLEVFVKEAHRKKRVRQIIADGMR